jgi:hypothetical protein
MEGRWYGRVESLSPFRVYLPAGQEVIGPGVLALRMPSVVAPVGVWGRRWCHGCSLQVELEVAWSRGTLCGALVAHQGEIGGLYGQWKQALVGGAEKPVMVIRLGIERVER